MVHKFNIHFWVLLLQVSPLGAPGRSPWPWEQCPRPWCTSSWVAWLLSLDGGAYARPWLAPPTPPTTLRPMMQINQGLLLLPEQGPLVQLRFKRSRKVGRNLTPRELPPPGRSTGGKPPRRRTTRGSKLLLFNCSPLNDTTKFRLNVFISSSSWFFFITYFAFHVS